MKSLTWNQVTAWRLAQHGLAPRLKDKAFVEITSLLYGIHAQVMSAAELALGVMLLIYAGRLISLSDLFQITGVHFISGYMLSAVAFLFLAEDTFNYLIGVVVIASDFVRRGSRVGKVSGLELLVMLCCLSIILFYDL